MGYGSYSASDWSKLKSSRQLSNTNSVEETFVSRSCNPKFNPRYIGTRECFADISATVAELLGVEFDGAGKAIEL